MTDDNYKLEFGNEEDDAQGVVTLINKNGEYTIKYQEYTKSEKVFFNLKRWLKRKLNRKTKP